MTFHYKADPGDNWAMFVLSAIRRPLVRYTLIGLILGILLVDCGSAYQRTKNRRDGFTAGQTAAVDTCVIVLFWFPLRALLTRVKLFGKPLEPEKVTISEGGFEVFSRMHQARYSWAAVCEIVVSRNYTYVLISGMAGFAFARTGFESPEVASRFCNELVSFAEPVRVVLLGKVKVSRQSTDHA